MEENLRLAQECRQLEALSHVDALTGLYNYRYFLKALEMEMERTRRSRLPTGLIMIDLDFFKQVNDTHGHQAGNMVLCWVGKIWKEGIRLIDIPFRFGGDEFALLLPGTSLGQSVKIAQRLRNALKQTPLVLDNLVMNLTASFGVAVFRHTEDLTVEGFIAKSDQYLIKAKLGARDLVCSQPKEEPPEDSVSPQEKGMLLGGNQ